MEYDESRELRRFVKACFMDVALPEELSLHNSLVEQAGGRFLWDKDAIRELMATGKSRASIAIERKTIANRVLALK